MARASTAAVSSVDGPTRNDEEERVDLLATACVNLAIVLCVFAIWSTYSPMTVPNRDITVTHIRHLVQHGSDQVLVPLSAANVTRLGLDGNAVFLVLFPRNWQTARWSHVLVHFHRYPFDKVRKIEVHLRQPEMRTLAWVKDRLILDVSFNKTLLRFPHLLVPCHGPRTTLGFAFFRLQDKRWDEAVIVRASRLVHSFPMVKIDETTWLAGRPSDRDRWRGRVRHIVDIPGNVSLFLQSKEGLW